MQVYTNTLLTFLNGTSRVFLVDNIDEYNFYKNVFNNNQNIVPIQFVVSHYGEYATNASYDPDEELENDNDNDDNENEDSEGGDDVWLEQLSVYNCIPIVHYNESQSSMTTLDEIISIPNNNENLSLNAIKGQFYSHYSDCYGTKDILNEPKELMNTVDENTFITSSILYTLDQHLCNYTENHKKRCIKTYKSNNQSAISQESINSNKLLNCIDLMKKHNILEIIETLDFNNKIYCIKDSTILIDNYNYERHAVYGYIGFLNLQD